MILDTIHLEDSDWIGTRDGLVIVNRVRSYNPNYFDFEVSNDTQRGVIARIKPDIKPEPKPQPKVKTTNTPSSLDFELNQLVAIDRLKKKLTTYSNGLDTYRDLKQWDKDKAILKHRSILKAKKIIQKYLSQLRADVNFTIKRVDKSIISLNYLGKYASCKRVVSF